MSTKNEDEGSSAMPYSECVNLCISLSNTNKINKDNAWNLQLIDVMRGNVTKPTEDDDSIEMDDEDADFQPTSSVAKAFQTQHHSKLPNFQKAATVLDAVAKIYSTRVDDTYSKIFKFKGGITQLEPTDEISEGDERGTTRARRLRDAKKGGVDTLEHRIGVLSKPIEKTVRVDPLYQRTATSIDLGGVNGLLMNNLFVVDGCRIVLDSQDQMPSLDLTMMTKNTRLNKRLAEMDIDIALNDLPSMLSSESQGLDIINLPLCTELGVMRDRRLAADRPMVSLDSDLMSMPDTPLRKKKKNEDGSNTYDHLGSPGFSMGHSHAYMRMDAENTSVNLDKSQSGFTVNTNNVGSGNGSSMTDDNEADESMFHAYAIGDDDDDGGYTDNNHYEPRNASLVRAPRMETVTSLISDSKVTLTDTSSLLGPSWYNIQQQKQRSLRQKLVVKSEDESKKRRPKVDSVAIDLASIVAANNQEAIGKKKKHVSSSLSEAMLRKHEAAAETLLLPIDVHFSVESLQSLFLKPQVVVPLRSAIVASEKRTQPRHNATATARINVNVLSGGSGGDDGALLFDDNNEYPTDNQHDNDDNDDDNQGESLFPHFLSNVDDGDNDGDDVSAELRMVDDVAHVGKTQVNYARVARQLNVRKMKKVIYNMLSAPTKSHIVLGGTLPRLAGRRMSLDRERGAVETELPHLPAEAAAMQETAKTQDPELLLDSESGLPKEQMILGGNQGEVVKTDFSTLVKEMKQSTNDRETGNHAVASCFISLLLLANEANLELRSIVAPHNHTTGKNTSQADIGFDLSNFLIYTPAAN